MTDPRLDLVRSLIRDIPDFPKPGILFKDITPLLAHPEGFNHSIALFEERFADAAVDAVVGMESRGFLFGAPLAARMNLPFVPARKPGKLPAAVERVEYDLEYGTDSLEIHKDALTAGQRVLVVDDLIATGGTAKATGDLVERIGAEVAGYAFLIDLTFLNGKEKLAPRRVEALLEY